MNTIVATQPNKRITNAQITRNFIRFSVITITILIKGPKVLVFSNIKMNLPQTKIAIKERW